MGVNLKELFERSPVKLEDLSGKVLAVDAYNMIFQFLSTIRSRDGNLLKDSKGRVTSHLIGLFSRTSHFLNIGIKPIFVFDGKHPELKHKEQERRQLAKQVAEKLYQEAAAQEDVEMMRKYAARTSRLNEEMIDDAKKLISLLGLPVVQAPSEGEAQAAHMVKNNDAWAVASQDYDSLVCGAPRLIQNLSIAGKRKNPKSLAYTTVSPELTELAPNLARLKITQDQLIMLAMLVGTDYNPGGVKGIGPKTALKLVLQHKSPESLFSAVEWDAKCDVAWNDVWDVFKKMPVSDDYKINFSSIKSSELRKFLVEERDFGSERVESTIKLLEQKQDKKKQTGLSDF